MKKQLKTYRTRKELASAMNRDPGTITRWIGDPGWPVGKAGPWSLADAGKVKEWRDRVQQALADDEDVRDVLAVSDKGDTDTMRAAKLDVLKERAAKLRIERRQLEGKLLDADAVERGQVERIEAVKAAMSALVNTLPPKLVGLGATAMEPVLLAEFRALCNGFAKG